jgi:hypothetical protein
MDGRQEAGSSQEDHPLSTSSGSRWQEFFKASRLTSASCPLQLLLCVWKQHFHFNRQWPGLTLFVSMCVSVVCCTTCVTEYR